MKVLILHQHFKLPQTGGAIRSYYLAKALVDQGHEPVVITGHNEKDYRRVQVEGIDIHYLPIAYDNRFQFYARGWSFAKFVWQSARLAATLKDVDLCYAISVPITVGWTARWLKWRHKIPYLFEVGDLWPDAPIQMGFVQNFLVQRVLFNLEKTSYKQARAVVALSPAIKSAIEKKVPAKKVYNIPNMADCDYYRPEIKNAELESKFGVKGKFVVSYIGAVGVANGLDYFLECANASRKANLPVHFIICGDGALLDRLKNNAHQLTLIESVQSAKGEWLTFIPFTHRDGVREVMNVTDAAFVCYKNVPILETGSPNKYFDALAAGKMIILNFGGWIRKDVEENQCGFYCDPRQPTDFVKKLSPIVNDQKQLRSLQQAARSLAMAKYSRTLLTQEWAKIVSSR
ncbi:MAG: glycosyltransferase family 4 protein [Bacteroidota bacterium]